MYNWFKIFNTADLDDAVLVSKTVTVILEGVGQKDILVTKGIGYGITYEGVFLSVGLNDASPFEFEGLAVYKSESNDVYLGIAVPDED